MNKKQNKLYLLAGLAVALMGAAAVNGVCGEFAWLDPAEFNKDLKAVEVPAAAQPDRAGPSAFMEINSCAVVDSRVYVLERPSLAQAVKLLQPCARDISLAYGKPVWIKKDGERVSIGVGGSGGNAVVAEKLETELAARGNKLFQYGVLLVIENDPFGLRTGLAAAVTGSSAEKAVTPPALACYNAAVNSTGLSGSGCMKLCRGAESTGPVDCYRTAVNSTSLANGDSIIELCRGAENTGPADCFRKAANTTSLADGASIIKLCKNARNTDPADCFKNASQTTSLSVEEILRFCRENPHHEHNGGW